MKQQVSFMTGMIVYEQQFLTVLDEVLHEENYQVHLLLLAAS